MTRPSGPSAPVPRAPIALLVAALLATALAGCLQGSGSPKTGTSAPASGPDPQTSGTIVGTVVDEENVLVPAVRIDLLGTKRWALTNQNGSFLFDVVPPGPHVVQATLGNQTPVRQSVVVNVGEVAQVVLHVAFPPITRPYNVTAVERGFLGCSVNGEQCPGYPSPNEKHLFDVHFGPEMAGLLVEVVWHPTVSPEALASLRIDVYQNSINSILNWTYGKPPVLRLRLPGEAHFRNVEGPIHVNVESDWTNAFIQAHPNAGALLEQDFTVYITQFYRQDQSGRFSAIPAG